MIVTRLKLANVRGVDAAELSFRPGLNVIVGVNGAGKTTALDALSVCLAAVTKRINSLRVPPVVFRPEDINVLAEALDVQLDLKLDGSQYSYVYHLDRDPAVAQADKTGLPREQTLDTPSFSRFLGSAPPTGTGRRALRHPLGVLFSTRRAVPTDRAPSRAAAADAYTAAFADAFSQRELRLAEFSAWIRAYKTISRESLAPTRVLDAFNRAVERFLPGYSDLHVTDGKTPRLLITKQDIEIPVRQLSDGERGLLALVLDLTRRLAQANPGLDDPAADGTGVVLIDEIDLHLHPKWQRDVVRRLPETFPKLQFIATTHSPQVIGEIPPERIQIMGSGPVVAPMHSYGVDSSRVLEEIMDAPSRTPEVQHLLENLSMRVSASDYAAAQTLADELSDKLGDRDPEVLRARTLLDFLTEDE